MRLVPQRRANRVVLGVVTVLVVIIGLSAAAYWTPLMSVRSTDVEGNKAVPGVQILSAANVANGTPLLQVDTEAVAQRVAAIPSVESVRVQRGYPSTLQITVVERTPVALVVDNDKVHVLDRSGVGYLTYAKDETPPEIKKLPTLHTATPGPADPTTKAALRVLADLPTNLSGLVQTVSTRSPVDIELGLTRDRTVVWGDSTQTEDKARTLTALLTRKATEYNVSAPDFPSYK